VKFAELVERSAELKRELVEFSGQPRFDRDRREALRACFGDRIVRDESELITAIDYFVLQHELRIGKTVLERFVASRTDLSGEDRDLLLGWLDVVEGIFEVRCRDGDALVTENLVDELSYPVHSNMGPTVFAPLEPGDFMVAKLVPVGSVWLLSGNFAWYPKSERAAVHRTAYEMAMRHPESVFRNPAKLARAEQVQKVEHDWFVRFFGTDFVVVPGPQLTERMRSYYSFCREQADAELTASGREPTGLPFVAPEYPADLVDSDVVAVIHDDIGGVGLYGGFGPVERVFADPDLLHQPDNRQRLRDYLDDDTVPPLLFERMAARDPGRASQVFRKLLGRKNFDRSNGGEKLMRRGKPNHFDRPRLPGTVPLSEKLAPYAAGG
jgi:hypothetical protein